MQYRYSDIAPSWWQSRLVQSRNKMLSSLALLECDLFSVYDDDGAHVGFVNRDLILRCIDAGYVFDLEHVPQIIVEGVNSITYSGPKLEMVLGTLYEVRKSSDATKVLRKIPCV